MSVNRNVRHMTGARDGRLARGAAGPDVVDDGAGR